LLNDKHVGADEKRRRGAAPEYVLGSVHALTETGSAIIASATGSQLPAYAYGAEKVIFVVGTQKIVPTLEAGMGRVTDHVLPLESERARKAYGVSGSSINKMLVLHKEVEAGRVTFILVKEALGF
jgi:L-lactate utilization protein LutC